MGHVQVYLFPCDIFHEVWKLKWMKRVWSVHFSVLPFATKWLCAERASPLDIWHDSTLKSQTANAQRDDILLIESGTLAQCSSTPGILHLLCLMAVAWFLPTLCPFRVDWAGCQDNGWFLKQWLTSLTETPLQLCSRPTRQMQLSWDRHATENKLKIQLNMCDTELDMSLL